MYKVYWNIFYELRIKHSCSYMFDKKSQIIYVLTKEKQKVEP